MSIQKSIRLAALALLAVTLLCGTSWASDIPAYSEMENRRDAFIDWLEQNRTGMEFRTVSKPFDGGAETNIALIIQDVDMQEAGEALNHPAAWCDVLFLHLNVKACIYGESDEGSWVRLYMGRKYYQKASKAEQIELEFNNGTTQDGVHWVSLSADEGPYNTSDYFVGLHAIETENGIYAELVSSQKAGTAINSAMDLYFQTLARNKVGFSVVGTHSDGSPRYAGGAQGMLERNVVRYLLALRVYMQTYETGGYEGLRIRAAQWYDATENYAEQLREVDRDDYLRDKEKEYRQQLDLQAGID